jgi:hypothetical protein
MFDNFFVDIPLIFRLMKVILLPGDKYFTGYLFKYFGDTYFIILYYGCNTWCQYFSWVF